MHPKLFSLLLAGGTAFAWAGWLLVWWRINPDEAGLFGISLFYVSAFLSLIGTFFFFDKFFRTKFASRQPMTATVEAALRQAMLFSLLVIGWLMLNSQKMATGWNLLLLVLGVATSELFFISRHRHPRPTITV